MAQHQANIKDNSTLAAPWENTVNGNASANQRGRQLVPPPNWQYRQVSMIHRPPNTLGCIGLSVLPTNLNGNTWNIPHNIPTLSGFGGSGNMKSHTQSGYNMAQPYSGVVNNANSSYMQQQPPMTNLVALGGSMHNYSSQTMYSQP